MTTMTRAAAGFSDVRHHPAVTATLVVLFWLAAAILVATSHVELDALSTSGGAVATIGAIVLAAYAYTRLCARHAGVSHALGVGIAWLVLAIGCEIVVSNRIGRGWYALIGSPGRPLLRNLFLFVWVFAPALFAQRESEE